MVQEAGQLAKLMNLIEQVVGAELLALRSQGRKGIVREGNDQARRGFLTELFEQVQTTQIGQFNIQQGYVRLALLEQLPTVPGTASQTHNGHPRQAAEQPG